MLLQCCRTFLTSLCLWFIVMCGPMILLKAQSPGSWLVTVTKSMIMIIYFIVIVSVNTPAHLGRRSLCIYLPKQYSDLTSRSILGVFAS